MKTMCPPHHSYHRHNGFVTTYALWHMTYEVSCRLIKNTYIYLYIYLYL